MDMRQDLRDLFDYERWASIQWLEPAKALGCEEVLLHIVKGQSLWMNRVAGTPVLSPSIETFKEDLDRSVEAWKQRISADDLSRAVSYEREGVKYEQPLLQIARHVINHGTYHRGHMRGIAGERNFDAFPETDFSRFCRERAAAVS